MSGKMKFVTAFVTLAALAGCDVPRTGLEVATLPKGEQVQMRAILAEYSDARGCVNYEQASNSCESIIDLLSVNGDRLVSHETGAFDLGDGRGTQTMTLRVSGEIEGERGCIEPEGVTIAKTSLPEDKASFILDVTRGVMAGLDGVCVSYFRSGDGYVSSSRGRDGRPFPPGDARIDFFTGTRALRPQ